MREFTVFFIILIVATILYIYLERRSLEVTYQKSESYGNVFLVRKASDQIDAANLLDNMCNNITTLITHLLKNKDTYNSKYVDGIYRFKNNFNRNKVYEKTQHTLSSTSYSINKGEKIIFCIRQKDTDILVDINTMMFVAIHECSHLMSKSIGHTEEFWDNMVFLLKEGIKIGIYDYVNYRHKPKEYCGMVITDTPYVR